MLSWRVRMGSNMLEMSSIGLDKLEEGNADPILVHHCIFTPLPSSGTTIWTLHHDLGACRPTLGAFTHLPSASRNLPHQHIPKANPASRPRLVSLGHQGPLQFHLGFTRTILHTARVLVSLSSHSLKSSLPLEKKKPIFPQKVEDMPGFPTTRLLDLSSGLGVYCTLCLLGGILSLYSTPAYLV